ncbi:uncharacterized protein LOC117240137 [Bombus vosnesenskii]|uniref:Uncharacterized protein LOC117240137 n=1 Tax=Bombus vosnesenskii TaxID=207650 RepID=A0A6J3L8F4_9HYME|nr:uncharacterized protein LOC117240137 [Bombus vosnesenskii]
MDYMRNTAILLIFAVATSSGHRINRKQIGNFPVTEEKTSGALQKTDRGARSTKLVDETCT